MDDEFPTLFSIKENFTVNEALKVDSLCDRILRDTGAIHTRITDTYANGRSMLMPKALVSLRRSIRELQDTVRATHPTAFFD